MYIASLSLCRKIREENFGVNIDTAYTTGTSTDYIDDYAQQMDYLQQLFPLSCLHKTPRFSIH